MRIWRELDGQNVLDILTCDLCGEQIPRNERGEFDFVRLRLQTSRTVDIDICEKCIYQKIMPLTLIERGV